MDTTPTRAPRTPLTTRTAAVWTVLRRELEAHAGEQLTVLDVGGGTGGFAVPMAEAGHNVTVVDASPDALAALTRRAADARVSDRIRAVQGDGDALAGLIPPGSVDLILCHAVLEVVDDPADVVTAIATALRPGGAVSLLVAGRAAAILGRAFNGHPTRARLLTDPDGRPGRGHPAPAYDAETAAALSARGPRRVERSRGTVWRTLRAPSGADPQVMVDGRWPVGASTVRDSQRKLHPSPAPVTGVAAALVVPEKRWARRRSG